MLLQLLLLGQFMPLNSAFTIKTTETGSFSSSYRRGSPLARQRIAIPAGDGIVASSSTRLLAIEVFDGSEVVSPVVVSNVFWAGLKGKIIVMLIAQLLAAVLFALLASFLASRVSNIEAFLSKSLSGDAPSPKKSSTGQRILSNVPSYESPMTPEKTVSPDFVKLLVCFAIDVIGSSSEIVPVLGEATDVIYAPIAAYLLRSLYGGSNNVLFALEFAEEILPFTDVLPLATIWCVHLLSSPHICVSGRFLPPPHPTPSF